MLEAHHASIQQAGPMKRPERAVLHSVVMALLAIVAYVQVTHAGHVTKDEVIALATERAEAWGASPARVLQIVACETGRTYRHDLVGSSGELGLSQWLAGGAWYSTTQYRDWGIDIRAMYRAGDPDAVFWDLDGLAYAQSWQSPRGLAGQWSC